MLLVNASQGPSQIQGTGLFANDRIAAGTVIWVLRPEFDLVLTKRELDELSPAAQEKIRQFIYIDVDTGKYILCRDDAKFMNHSDSPNTSTQAGKTVALCDIECGAELTGDYREFDAATRQKMARGESLTH